MDLNSIYYGRQDYEEDDDAYGPFNITNKTFEVQKKQPVIELGGITKNPSAENLNTDKIKMKIKKMVEKSEKLKECAEEKMEIKVRPFVETELERMGLMSPPGIVRQVIETERSPPKIEDVQYGSVSPQIQFISPRMPYQPPINSMLQQNIYNNASHATKFIRGNPCLLLNMLNNPQRFPVTQTPTERVANNSYSVTSTYSHRLLVVDALFKFIMQILQSPEPPSFVQIDLLKKMLDSMVQPNYFDMLSSMK